MNRGARRVAGGVAADGAVGVLWQLLADSSPGNGFLCHSVVCRPQGGIVATCRRNRPMTAGEGANVSSFRRSAVRRRGAVSLAGASLLLAPLVAEIGRASCRERAYIGGGATVDR